MLDEINQETSQRMQKSINVFSSNLRKIRTGRATPDILDSVQIEYYGNTTPIKQLANITVEDSQTLAISPWEQKFIPEIEQAIVKANLGLNPITSGSSVHYTEFFGNKFIVGNGFKMQCIIISQGIL